MWASKLDKMNADLAKAGVYNSPKAHHRTCCCPKQCSPRQASSDLGCRNSQLSFAHAPLNLTPLTRTVDRLTRSLADFAKLVELFDAHDVSFVSVTQSFNTTSSMGRLTLNVLLSFAQFEREVIGERVRDKIAASKRKGIWVGGPVPLGYRSVGKKIEIVPERCGARPQNLRGLSAAAVDRRAVCLSGKRSHQAGVERETVHCPAIDGIIQEADEVSGEVDDKQRRDGTRLPYNVRASLV
jgi:hypothetical protein